jgi:3-oxoacyl-(acyl-carrier-protein) synthase
METGIIPRILNLEEPCDDDLNFAITNQNKPVNVILKQAYGMGYINTALVFKNF